MEDAVAQPSSSALSVAGWWVGWWALFQVVHAVTGPAADRVFPGRFKGGKAKRVLAQNIVASVHAALATVLSLYTLSFSAAGDFVSPQFGADELFGVEQRTWVIRTMEVTCGYMLYDVVETCTDGEGALSLRGARKDVAMMCHHAFIIVGYKLCMDSGIAAQLPVLLEVAEVSTPLYHIRWFLCTTGRDESSSALTRGVSIVFFFLFVAVRGLFYLFVASFPLRAYLGRNSSPAVVVAGAITYAFVALNFFWVSLAIRKMVRHLRGDPAALNKKA